MSLASHAFHCDCIAQRVALARSFICHWLALPYFRKVWKWCALFIIQNRKNEKRRRTTKRIKENRKHCWKTLKSMLRKCNAQCMYRTQAARHTYQRQHAYLHTRTHTVTQLVAQILALHILWRLKFLWQFARRATLGRKSQQNAKQSVAQTELLRLNAVRDALK